MFDLQSELAKERTQPANGFRINGSAVVAEGVEIQLGHPACGGTPALFTGSSYMKLDRRRPCLFNKQYGKYVARRVQIEEIQIESLKAPVRILKRPDIDANLEILLQVDPHVDFGKNISLRDELFFWAGAETTGTVIERSRGEALIQMPDGSQTDVFYTDGRVVRVVRTGTVLQTIKLTLEEQASLRLNQALRSVENADGDPIRSDRGYHMIATVLSIGGKHSATVFESVYSALESAAACAMMGDRVKDRVIKILNKISPDHAVTFERAFIARYLAHKGVVAFPSSPSLVSERKGPPAARVQFVRNRAMEIALARAESNKTKKGSGGGNSVQLPTNPKSIKRREKQHAAAAARK